MNGRSWEVCIFKKLKPLLAYLRSIGICRFAGDASGFDVSAVTVYKRDYNVAAYDKWFEQAVKKKKEWMLTIGWQFRYRIMT
jgi:hypothetical protein